MNKKWLDSLQENDTVQVRWPWNDATSWNGEIHMAKVLRTGHRIHVQYFDIMDVFCPEKLRKESFHPDTGRSGPYAYLEPVGTPVVKRGTNEQTSHAAL